MEELKPDELRIFVGHSSDATKEAKEIYSLEAEFQRKLKQRLKFVDGAPFKSVRLWEWEIDASASPGGQHKNVDPYLLQSHIAIFVFKERVGVETWKEVIRFRDGEDGKRPVIAVFPAELPHSAKMIDRKVANAWSDLLEKQVDLTKGWGEPGSRAVRPIDGYTNATDLKQIVLEQFERDLEGVIERAGLSPSLTSLQALTRMGDFYETSDQMSFDRRRMLTFPVSSLDQARVSELLAQPKAQRELATAGLPNATDVTKLAHLGLTSDGKVSMGLFLCCAPREHLVGKFSSCSLKLVVYNRPERAAADITYSAEPVGNLLSLYEAGMEFFHRDARLDRFGRPGSDQRDDLEIPAIALHEALVNALIHRDYETATARAQPTRIEVYPDKVEISSFGGLMQGVSLQKLNENAEAVNQVRRNEVITEIFSLSQRAELNASGVARIHRQLRERELPNALIELLKTEDAAASADIVKIVLYRRRIYPGLEQYEHDHSRLPVSGRPLRVFLSSTFKDLEEYRRIAVDIGRQQGFLVSGVESLATGESWIPQIREELDRADVFIGLIGARYGTVAPGGSKSLTELEFEYARTRALPILMYNIENDFFKASEIDEPSRAAAFLDRVRGEQLVDNVKSAGDMRAKLARGLRSVTEKLFADREAAIQARALDVPQLPSPFAAQPIPRLGKAMAGRQDEVKAISAWLGSDAGDRAPNPVLSISGIGGMGKTTLAASMFEAQSDSALEAYAGRFWWSFYDTTAGFRDFLAAALAYVSGADARDVYRLPSHVSAERLLQALDQKRFFFVLDGVERLLVAYDRISRDMMADEEPGETPDLTQDPAEFSRPEEEHFFSRLMRVRKSKILITSRLMPKTLDASDSDAGGITRLALSGLDPRSAIDMVRRSGVLGDDAELKWVVDSFGGHPLSLRLLAGTIAEYRPAPGDLARWRRDHEGLDLRSNATAVRNEVLDAAFQSLSPKSREILGALAQVSGSMSYSFARGILASVVQVSEDDLGRSLEELERRGFLSWDRAENIYDMHPVVRAFARESLVK